MCGICGTLNFDLTQPADKRLLQRMCTALAHRGPDGEGIYCQGPIGLGHRRLSIIDLSDHGRQPMSNTSGSLWIVFNGEIYNFHELRQDLQAKGYVFSSGTDTEILLYLYETEGVKCLERLRGMFAFAIWDERNKSLFVARDRVGEKPFFYVANEQFFLFASELNALLQHPGIGSAIDPVAIHHYLTYQYVPSPLCALQGVRKLPPAHYLICKDGRVEVERYWQLAYLPKIEVRNRRQQADLEVELLDRLRESVRLRLVSDVPIGAFLSGGIDSSAVVAMMSKLSPTPVKTFAIGFGETAYNELPYARLVARQFQTDHVEFQVTPDLSGLLEKIVAHYGEPYADSSAIPTFCLCQLASKYVKVILTGDGGDENFAGYRRYLANQYAEKYRAVAHLLGSKAIQSILQKIPSGGSHHSLWWRLQRLAAHVAQPKETRYLGWICHFDNEQKQQLYTEEFKRAVGAVDSATLLLSNYQAAQASDSLDATLYADVAMYLPDDLLVKTDIASMASALECRAPFLDHQFMEFAAKIPSNLKLKGNQGKYILKRALRNLLPDQIRRRPKVGLGVPLDSWLRNELKPFAYDVLLSKNCLQRGYFRPAYVEKLLREHCTGQWNWHYQIWNLMMLELWQQAIVKRM